MEKQKYMIPPKIHNSSIMEPKDIEMAAMLNKKFKSLILKVINDLEKTSNK
jgi:hypothetical protein